MNSLVNNIKKINIFKNVPYILPNINVSTCLTSKIYYNYKNNIECKNVLEYVNMETYEKILFYRNNLLECFFIYWKQNSMCKIHDHSENGCYFKILNGSLNEYVYDTNLNLIEMSVYPKNHIGYIDNTIGYHKMENLNDELVTSLHIYSPPNYKGNVFN